MTALSIDGIVYIRCASFPVEDCIADEGQRQRQMGIKSGAVKRQSRGPWMQAPSLVPNVYFLLPPTKSRRSSFLFQSSLEAFPVLNLSLFFQSNTEAVPSSSSSERVSM